MKARNPSAKSNSRSVKLENQELKNLQILGQRNSFAIGQSKTANDADFVIQPSKGVSKISLDIPNVKQGNYRTDYCELEIYQSPSKQKNLETVRREGLDSNKKSAENSLDDGGQHSPDRTHPLIERPN